MSVISHQVKLFRPHGTVSSFLSVVSLHQRLHKHGHSQTQLLSIRNLNSRSQTPETLHLCAFQLFALISDVFQSHISVLIKDGSACATDQFMTNSVVYVRAQPPVTFLTSTTRHTELPCASRSKNFPTSHPSSSMFERACWCI